MQLDTLLAQLPLAERPLRCLAELQYLHACAGKELANPLRFSARLGGPKGVDEGLERGSKGQY